MVWIYFGNESFGGRKEPNIILSKNDVFTFYFDSKRWQSRHNFATTVYFLLLAVGCKFILYITSCLRVKCDLTVWWAIMIYFWRFFYRGRVFNLISTSWTDWEWYFEERTNMINLNFLFIRKVEELEYFDLYSYDSGIFAA